MKNFAIATLLGLFLSGSALASNADYAQQIRSSCSKAASAYVYVNRIAAPSDKATPPAATSAAERLSNQL